MEDLIQNGDEEEEKENENNFEEEKNEKKFDIEEKEKKNGLQKENSNDNIEDILKEDIKRERRRNGKNIKKNVNWNNARQSEEKDQINGEKNSQMEVKEELELNKGDNGKKMTNRKGKQLENGSVDKKNSPENKNYELPMNNKGVEKKSENIFINSALKSYSMTGMKEPTKETSKQEISFNFIFLIKTSISQMSIASLPYSPYILLSILITVEIIWIILNFYFHFKKKIYLHNIFFFKKITEGFFFVSFYVEMIILLIQDRPSLTMQRIMKYSIIVGVFSEYFFTISLLLFGIVNRLKKKDKKEKI